VISYMTTKVSFCHCSNLCSGQIVKEEKEGGGRDYTKEEKLKLFEIINTREKLVMYDHACKFMRGTQHYKVRFLEPCTGSIDMIDGIRFNYMSVMRDLIYHKIERAEKWEDARIVYRGMCELQSPLFGLPKELVLDMMLDRPVQRVAVHTEVMYVHIPQVIVEPTLVGVNRTGLSGINPIKSSIYENTGQAEEYVKKKYVSRVSDLTSILKRVDLGRYERCLSWGDGAGTGYAAFKSLGIDALCYDPSLVMCQIAEKYGNIVSVDKPVITSRDFVLLSHVLDYDRDVLQKCLSIGAAVVVFEEHCNFIGMRELKDCSFSGIGNVRTNINDFVLGSLLSNVVDRRSGVSDRLPMRIINKYTSFCFHGTDTMRVFNFLVTLDFYKRFKFSFKHVNDSEVIIRRHGLSEGATDNCLHVCGRECLCSHLESVYDVFLHQEMGYIQLSKLFSTAGEVPPSLITRYSRNISSRVSGHVSSSLIISWQSPSLEIGKWYLFRDVRSVTYKFPSNATSAFSNFIIRESLIEEFFEVMFLCDGIFEVLCSCIHADKILVGHKHVVNVSNIQRVRPAGVNCWVSLPYLFTTEWLCKTMLWLPIEAISYCQQRDFIRVDSDCWVNQSGYRALPPGMKLSSAALDVLQVYKDPTYYEVTSYLRKKPRKYRELKGKFKTTEHVLAVMLREMKKKNLLVYGSLKDDEYLLYTA